MRKRMTFIDDSEATLSIERQGDKLVFEIEEDDDDTLPEFSPKEAAEIGRFIILQTDEIESDIKLRNQNGDE